PEKAINFWLAGRLVAAIVLLYIALRPVQDWSPMRCYSALVLALTLALAVWWIGFWHAEWLPRTFIAGQGLTGFKVVSEYLLAVLYAVAAILLFRRGQRRANVEAQVLAAAAWIQALAELFFTLYSDVTDLFNLLGHVYKAAAYIMVYRAIYVAGVTAPYRQLDFERSRLRVVLTTIPDPIWLKDENGCYLACNTAFERLFGASETDIIGKTDYDFVSQEQADFFRHKDRAAIEAGKSSSNEEWLTFAGDGYYGLFETTKTPMLAPDHAVLGVLGVAHDITERKQAETRLRDSEKHFRTLANSGSALIWTSDQAQCANYFNEPWFIFTGRGPKQELGTGWLEGVHPEDREACIQCGKLAFVERKAFKREYRLLDADGRYRWVLDEASPRYDSKEQFLGYIGFCWDMTEYKAAADKIEQLAFYDPLTQLPNRRLMLDRLELALAASLRY
ncbi:sensor domain-containing diguanylate cyclase, partial [Craterilacuibacter sp.]|uniref:sensor domain-containing diguanylate cyclase n=1 Tax=Craterilacuibacter sp. TaxID=2870909 RepID=UPI003F35CFCD